MVVRSSFGFVFGVAFTVGVVGVFAGVCGRVVDGVERGCAELEVGSSELAALVFVLSGTVTVEFTFASFTAETVALGDGCAVGEDGGTAAGAACGRR